MTKNKRKGMPSDRRNVFTGLLRRMDDFSFFSFRMEACAAISAPFALLVPLLKLRGTKIKTVKRRFRFFTVL